MWLKLFLGSFVIIFGLLTIRDPIWRIFTSEAECQALCRRDSCRRGPCRQDPCCQDLRCRDLWVLCGQDLCGWDLCGRPRVAETCAVGTWHSTAKALCPKLCEASPQNVYSAVFGRTKFQPRDEFIYVRRP